jgi:glycosyltransferase involved in cell wall biosynthesis
MALLDHDEYPDLPGSFSALAPARRRRRMPENDARSPEPDPPIAAELECLHGAIATRTLQVATRRSHALGIGADRILIDWGVIEETIYLQRLTEQLGIGVARLDGGDGGQCLLAPPQYPQAATLGLFPIRRQDGVRFVVASRGRSARMLSELAVARPDLIAQFELATSDDFNRFLTEDCGDELARQAADGLQTRWPDLSATSRAATWWQHCRRAAIIVGIAAAIAVPSLLGEAIWTAMLTTAFLVFAGFRLLGCLVPRLPEPKRRHLPDAGLPAYTVMVALYREATSVAPLLQAIADLDYPREKLDVILITEAADDITRHAIARLQPMPHVQVITVPAIGPQTKPRALNFALPFARGHYVAVFDAEDRPEPRQLRAALDAFDHHGPGIACVQASLCIDNASEGLLARMFAAEYAGQFDVLLPGLAALQLPLPLGGSSNHFRADVLRDVGGWDAYNVTEDADLGIRLARFGYRCVTFASTTYEEAPVHCGAWLRQRSRWMKGWMQTAGVHLHQPLRLWRDVGSMKTFGVAVIAGGNVLTALAYPLLLVEIALLLGRAGVTGDVSGFLVDRLMPLHLAAISAGYLSTIVIGLKGLARRRQLQHAWILLLAPLYWGLLSVAAWRALWQLLREPHRWEKTQHAMSRRSKAMRAGTG